MGYPTRTGGQPAPNRIAQDERAAALVGDRGRGAASLKAVTVGDAEGGGTVTLKSRVISAAPTQDDYNALVTDIRAIAGVLQRMGAKFSGL